MAQELQGCGAAVYELGDGQKVSIRMYTLALLGIAVQYALGGRLDGYGRSPVCVSAVCVPEARIFCIFVLPKMLDISSVFYVGSISDSVGVAFSLFLFVCFINPRLNAAIGNEQNHA